MKMAGSYGMPCPPGTPGRNPGEARASFLAAVRNRSGAFIIGVAGDSGTGKTIFTSSLRHLLGDNLVSTITLDDYHLFDREQRKVRNITPLDPKANDLAGLERDLQLLKAGKPIRKMVYDHDRGKLEGPVGFSPTPIVIIEGLHSLSTQGIRNLVDASLYVDPDPDVKREWKLKRDTGKRGYSEREAIEEMARREKDYLRHIAPQKNFADTIIRISFSRFGRDLGWQQNIYRTTLLQLPPEQADEDLSLIVTLNSLLNLRSPAFSIGYSRNDWGGRKMSALSFDGSFDPCFLSSLAASLKADTGSDPRDFFPESRLTPSEIVQVLFCWRAVRALLNEEKNSSKMD
jgi:phosphoribulokinase